MMGMTAGSADSGMQALLELVTNPQAVKDRVAALQAEQAKLADINTQAAASKASAEKAQADAAVAIKANAESMAALDKKAADVQAASDAAAAQQTKAQSVLDAREGDLLRRENTVTAKEQQVDGAVKSLDNATAVFQKQQAQAQRDIAAFETQAKSDADAAAALKADYEQRLASLKKLVA